jgi:hypothetical protein
MLGKVVVLFKVVALDEDMKISFGDRLSKTSLGYVTWVN